MKKTTRYVVGAATAALAVVGGYKARQNYMEAETQVGTDEEKKRASYVYGAVGAAGLLTTLFLLWPRSRRRR
jgi:hypothetical protein